MTAENKMELLEKKIDKLINRSSGNFSEKEKESILTLAREIRLKNNYTFSENLEKLGNSELPSFDLFRKEKAKEKRERQRLIEKLSIVMGNDERVHRNPLDSTNTFSSFVNVKVEELGHQTLNVPFEIAKIPEKTEDQMVLEESNLLNLLTSRGGKKMFKKKQCLHEEQRPLEELNKLIILDDGLENKSLQKNLISLEELANLNISNEEDILSNPLVSTLLQGTNQDESGKSDYLAQQIINSSFLQVENILKFDNHSTELADLQVKDLKGLFANYLYNRGFQMFEGISQATFSEMQLKEALTDILHKESHNEKQLISFLNKSSSRGLPKHFLEDKYGKQIQILNQDFKEDFSHPEMITDLTRLKKLSKQKKTTITEDKVDLVISNYKNIVQEFKRNKSITEENDDVKLEVNKLDLLWGLTILEKKEVIKALELQRITRGGNISRCKQYLLMLRLAEDHQEREMVLQKLRKEFVLFSKTDKPEDDSKSNAEQFNLFELFVDTVARNLESDINLEMQNQIDETILQIQNGSWEDTSQTKTGLESKSSADQQNEQLTKEESSESSLVQTLNKILRKGLNANNSVGDGILKIMNKHSKMNVKKKRSDKLKEDSPENFLSSQDNIASLVKNHSESKDYSNASFKDFLEKTQLAIIGGWDSFNKTQDCTQHYLYCYFLIKFKDT